MDLVLLVAVVSSEFESIVVLDIKCPSCLPAVVSSDSTSFKSELKID